ncbi:MAG: hydroxyacid dehydrogenase, partial [Bacteroidales bacterium]|nr:hydroxyacid dehydrogenase [Bacteroidales bacterium]
MLLGLSCHTAYYDNKVKSGEYTRGNLVSDVTRKWGELSGQRLGIIGLGTIGSRVAALAEGFGMEVCYYATSGKPHSDKYRSLSLEELLKTSDFISVHAPLNDRTDNLVTYEKLKLCKPTAKVINIGRGGIINEEDLVKALNDNLIEGIGIDVFSKEPIPETSPYLKIEDKTKAILLPHIGWTSKEARTLLVSKIAENIKTEGIG